MIVLQDDVHEDIIAAFPILRLNESLIVAAGTLYLYDWFLTIDLEINLVWPSNLSAIKVLYFIQRYSPLFDTVLLVIGHQLFFSSDSIEQCARGFKSAGWLFLGGVAISEVVLTCRCIAVWGNTKRNLYIFLSLLVLVCWVPCFVIMEVYLKSLTFNSVPYPPIHCFTPEGSHILYLCWGLIAVYDAGTLAVMVIAGIRHSVPGCRQSTLFQVVYRDGALYYLYMFVLSASNVIVVLTLPSGYATLMASLERVIHSVLTSRVVLHIRETAHHEPSTQPSRGVSVSRSGLS
ncbi:hypothetical protein BDN72DRAFT_264077 [Pluteus cervinus]|uniref:Uncharacterized protein n=1 Tax=Pluteus cervinus TaxID=181527 RepID=A0ACD3AHX7_9AGAR|nr:hypothetical protein BDN72DRAFT_264077 [Pluteus cervinus]